MSDSIAMVMATASVKAELAGKSPLNAMIAAIEAADRAGYALAPKIAAPTIARPLADWHEDLGSKVWWFFPMDEAPWIGTPLDSDWPGYHTHFTELPALPVEPDPERAAGPNWAGKAEADQERRRLDRAIATALRTEPVRR